MPCSIGLMYSFGIVPPMISFSKTKPAPAPLGSTVILHMTVLAAAAGLPDVLAFGFGLLADRFAVRHLRLADIGADAELAHHAVDDDFQVQLAHSGNDRLRRSRDPCESGTSDLPAPAC